MPACDLRLIVLRGNSGSGKTTLARMLQRSMGRGTANIGQDHLRRIILREHDVPCGDNINFIRDTAQYCSELGYHVIIEGILRSAHYGEMLRKLCADHPGPVHVFYLDVPLAQTLVRHEGKPLRDEVAPATLVDWYLDHDVLDVPGEVILDTSTFTEQETLDLLLAEIGPVPAAR